MLSLATGSRSEFTAPVRQGLDKNVFFFFKSEKRGRNLIVDRVASGIFVCYVSYMNCKSLTGAAM